MFTHRTLEAWKEAQQVSLLILHASKLHWKPWAAALFDQMQRASASVHLNITEGYSYGTKPSYAKHLGIAYGSAVEVGDALELLLKAGILPEEIGSELLRHNQRCQRLLVGLLKKRRPFAASSVS